MAEYTSVACTHMSSAGSLAEYPGPRTSSCRRFTIRTAWMAWARLPNTHASVRSKVRRSRPAGSSWKLLWSRTPAATLGWANCISTAHVPPRVTAASRLTRQIIELGPKRPASSSKLRCAMDLSLESAVRDDAHYMERALAQARQAAAIGEVPVGAVLVRDGSVLAEAHNLIESTPDAAAHAEMLVLREGARLTQSWRLERMTLYVTLEPCPMCAGAMALARIERLVYGAPDPRKGAVDSVYDVLRHPANTHLAQVSAGVLAEPAGRLLREFFAARRARN